MIRSNLRCANRIADFKYESLVLLPPREHVRVTRGVVRGRRRLHVNRKARQCGRSLRREHIPNGGVLGAGVHRREAICRRAERTFGARPGGAILVQVQHQRIQRIQRVYGEHSRIRNSSGCGHCLVQPGESAQENCRER